MEPQQELRGAGERSGRTRGCLMLANPKWLLVHCGAGEAAPSMSTQLLLVHSPSFLEKHCPYCTSGDVACGLLIISRCYLVGRLGVASGGLEHAAVVMEPLSRC